MNIELEAMAIEMPEVSRHPNRLPFRGVLTLVDVASDQPPQGAREHRVLLTRDAAEKALPSLLGMALDYAPTFDSHDAKRKVGIITEANVASLKSQVASQSIGLATHDSRPATGIEVSGYLFAKDFPEVVRELRLHASRLGMSYEISDARVENTRASVWTLTEVTFTGAAILRREKAAYRGTWIELSAGAGLSFLHPERSEGALPEQNCRG